MKCIVLGKTHHHMCAGWKLEIRWNWNRKWYSFRPKLKLHGTKDNTCWRQTTTIITNEHCKFDIISLAFQCNRLIGSKIKIEGKNEKQEFTVTKQKKHTNREQKCAKDERICVQNHRLTRNIKVTYRSAYFFFFFFSIITWKIHLVQFLPLQQKFSQETIDPMQFNNKIKCIKQVRHK